MMQNKARQDGTPPRWQLLRPLPAAGEQEAMQGIAEEVEAVGLEPGQVERIARSVGQALRRGGGGEGGCLSPATIRVWASGLPPAGGAAGQQGVGFFLLERREPASQAGGAGPQRLIEICVYREAGSSR
mgnify:CR=1 FL=1